MTVPRFELQAATRLGLALLLGIGPTAAHSGPGAHGPQGEHLDAREAPPSPGAAVPRFESKSEDFEVVGRLQGGELSIFINRFRTNEPVENAMVELELGSLKAAAPFHADQGDYAVADGAFLRAVSEPGDHAIVIALVAGGDSDLLEGTLSVRGAVPSAASGHGHRDWPRIAGIGAALLAGVGVGWLWGRHRSSRTSRKGGA